MGRLSREAWAAHVYRWRSSGQSAADFAAAAGVEAKRLEYWASRVGRVPPRRRRAVSETAIAVRPARSPWVELMSCSQGVVATSGAELEVVAARGRIVRVPVGFDSETLRRLLVVVEAC